MAGESEDKKLLGCLVAFMGIFFVMPLWYYLLYRLLQAAHADTAMWVCYWVYTPLGLLLGMIKALWEAK